MKIAILTTSALIGAGMLAAAQQAGQSQQQRPQAQQGQQQGQYPQGQQGQSGQQGQFQQGQPGQSGQSSQFGQQGQGMQGQQGQAQQAQQRQQQQAQQRQQQQAQQRQQHQGQQAGGSQEMDRGEIQLGSAPASVRKAFTSHSMGGEVDEQVRHVNIDGQDVYVAKVDPSEAQELQLYVTADGEVLKTQQELELNKAPQEIRSSIEKFSEREGNSLAKLFREMREGKLSYIAEIKRPNNQPVLNLQLDESGNVIKQWEAQPGQQGQQGQQGRGQE